jgi:hypothetical protein
MNTRQAYVELVIGYIFGIAHIFSKDNVLFILSAAASVMAIINYYIQIKRNRPK